MIRSMGEIGCLYAVSQPREGVFLDTSTTNFVYWPWMHSMYGGKTDVYTIASSNILWEKN